VNIATVLHDVFSDTQLQTILLLVVLDLVLGVLAALKLGQFKLAYLANFARNDVLAKALPWAALDVGAVIAGSAHLLIPGFDLTNTAHAAFALVAAALVGSILGSVKELGLSGVPAALGSGR
jgi:hypothetical protein